MPPPRKVLLCRTDRLGDVILALPCASLIKRMFPDCRVGFLTREYTAPVAEICTSVDEVISLNDNFSRRDVNFALKNSDYDAAVVLFPDAKVAQALFVNRIPLRAGTAYRLCSVFFNRRHKEHRKYNLKHEVEYNLTLTCTAFDRNGNWMDYIAPDDLFPLEFRISEIVKAKVGELFSGFNLENREIVAIHPGGSGSAHRWEVEKYAELTRRLTRNPTTFVIITGSDAERNLCSILEDSAEGNFANLCGKLSLVELAETYRHCLLLVTNSTGTLHLARAVGTVALGLFPNDPSMSPVRWGPYGIPECVLQPPGDAQLNRLGVETVFNKVLNFLEK